MDKPMEPTPGREPGTGLSPGGESDGWGAFRARWEEEEAPLFSWSSLEAVLDLIPEGTAVVDPEGRIRVANGALGRLLGEPADRLRGRELAALAAPEHRGRVEGFLRGPAGGEQLEMRLRAASGRTVPVMLRWASVRGPEGVLGRAVLVLDRVARARQEEREAESRAVRALAELATGALLLCDGEGTVVLASPGAAELLGTEAEGRPLDALLPLSREGERLDFRGLLGLEGDAVPLEGAEGRALLLRRRLLGTAERPLGAVLALEEGVPAPAAGDSPWQAQKVESLGVLAAGVAHDFNNMLTALMGYLDMAQLDLPPGSPVGAYLQKMESTVLRAADLTRQMLAYSGQGQFQVKPLQLNHVIDGTVHLIRAAVPKKVGIQYHLEPELPLVEADWSQVQQLLLALVTRAVEAVGGEKGGIAIRTFRQAAADGEVALEGDRRLPAGDYVVLEVSDQGEGQGRASLGGVAALLPGPAAGFRILSEGGEGTRVRLFFPARPSEAEAPPAQPAEAAAGGLLLVVDDEEVVRSSAAAILRRMGYQVLEAANGQEAVDLYGGHLGEISAVLMDLTMPVMNGEEAFRRIRGMDPDARVLLCSGYSEQEAVKSFVGQGLAGFIQKPYQRRDLQAALQRVIGAETGRG